MLAKWPFVTPIPGSRKIERIDENLGAADVDLTADELARIEGNLLGCRSTGTELTRILPSCATVDPSGYDTRNQSRAREGDKATILVRQPVSEVLL
jgi:aryl-alcohol dehydrogenase-like predicted oxidoreductase